MVRRGLVKTYNFKPVANFLSSYSIRTVRCCDFLPLTFNESKCFPRLEWPVPGRQEPILGLRGPTPGSRGPILGPKCPISDLRGPIPGLEGTFQKRKRRKTASFIFGKRPRWPGDPFMTRHPVVIGLIPPQHALLLCFRRHQRRQEGTPSG